jgi:hypothetical protein
VVGDTREWVILETSLKLAQCSNKQSASAKYMPITRIGKFLETADLGIAYSLGIESEHLDSCIAEINKREIRGVFGCPHFGFKESNLNFLKALHEIKQAWFWEIDLKDIEGLYSQEHIEYFGVMTKRPAIDYSRFKKLRDLVWEPVKNDRGIKQLEKLERLDVWRYKTKDKSFEGLELPKSLKKLEFNWCNQEAISSLPAMPNLEELQFHYCRSLKSLSGIKNIAPNLKKLVVTRCANLESFDEAAGMNLGHIYINVKSKDLANHKAKNKH